MAAKLEKLSEDFLHCSLCLESFRDPRSLGCLHTFCCPCLMSYAQSLVAGPGARLPCPVCREETTLPIAEGVTGLKSNYFVKNLQEFVGRPVEAELCGLCDSGYVGVSRCVECESVLCQQCTTMHSTVKTFKKHMVSPIQNPEESSVPKQAKCENHGEPFQFYCTESKCDQLLCSSCCKEHESHEVIDLKVQNETCIFKLSKILVQLNATESMQSNLHNLFTRQQQEMPTKKEDVLRSIDLHIENIIEKVKQAGEVFKKKAVNTFDEQNTTINKQLEEVSGLIASVSYMKQFIQQLMEKGSPADLVSIAEVALSRAEEVLKNGNGEKLLNETLVSYVPGKIDVFVLQSCIGNMAKIENWKDLEFVGSNASQIPALLEKPVLKISFQCGAPGDKQSPYITRICEGPEGDLACYDSNNARLKVFYKNGRLKWASQHSSLSQPPLNLEWNSEKDAYVLKCKTKYFYTIKTWGFVEKISDGSFPKKSKETSIILEKQDGPSLVKLWAPDLNPESDEYTSCFHVSSTSSMAKVSPSGEVIVLSKDEECIWKFDIKGNLLWHKFTNNTPLNVYFDRFGCSYIVTYNAVLILNMEGDILQTINFSGMIYSNITFSSNDEMIYFCGIAVIYNQLYA